MGLKFKVGAQVVQKVVPFAGKVVEVKIIDDDVSFMVECVEADGHVATRQFTEDQIEAAKADDAALDQVQA